MPPSRHTILHHKIAGSLEERIVSSI